MNSKFLLDLKHPNLSTSFVGFDRLFNELFKHQGIQHNSPSYPPYNLFRDDDTYTIEMALAGLTNKDIDVEVAENVLTISYVKVDNKDDEVIHRGLAMRSFKRSFNLAEDIEVKKASFKNGLLSIVMERIIPDEKKPRKIKIS